MAQENPTELSETVSREAHQRMTNERNELQAKVDELSSTLKDLSFNDKAREHFSDKGVDDPKWAADIALASMKSAGVELDGISAYLDDKFEKLYPKEGEPKPEGTLPVDGVPTPDAVEPPGFARPSPAAEGAPPGQKVYTIKDPEIQALIQANDRDGIAKLEKAGQFKWLSDAPVSPG